MANLRTPEMEHRYREYQKTDFGPGICTLCEKAPPIKEFTHWKIVENLFPWDRIAKTQHMVIPKRHVTYAELTEEEKKEFDEIKLGDVEEKEYDLIAEATNKLKTIPAHFHVHLIKLKDF